MRHRKHDINRHGTLYIYLENGGLCVYCGEPSACNDHFLPISKSVQMAETHDVGSGRYLLPSCADCNKIAADKVFETVEEKRKYIQNILVKKFSRAVHSYTQEEVNELGFNLQTAIISAARKNDAIIRRLKWENSLNPNAEIAKIRLHPSEHGRNFVAGDASSIFTRRSDKGSLTSQERLRRRGIEEAGYEDVVKRYGRRIADIWYNRYTRS